MTDPAPAESVRFPGFNTLEQAHIWDDVTRRVVLSRVEDVPQVSFFSAREEQAARALLNCLLALEPKHAVPVVELIDARLAAGDGDGYRYEAMPEDADAWRRSLAGLDREAQATYGSVFAGISGDERHAIVQSIHDRDGAWVGMPTRRVFELWMRYACAAFYSHPWAWNEIGFGGPAYPRGYKNLGLGRREPWEIAEADAEDPVPWVQRVEAARRRHEGARTDAPRTE